MVEISERLHALAGVIVDWIETLVDLDLKKAVVLFSEFVEFTMLCKTFDDGLGGHDVEAALEGCFDDLVVGVVGRKDAADVAGFEIFQGLICMVSIFLGGVVG